MSSNIQSGPVAFGAAVFVAVTLSSCSVGLSEAKTIHNDAVSMAEAGRALPVGPGGVVGISREGRRRSRLAAWSLSLATRSLVRSGLRIKCLVMVRSIW